jgi:methionyl-tRNA formyltransferase
MTSDLDILFAGSGAFGVPTLRALADRHRVARVYTQPDQPAGRGKKLKPTPIADVANELGLEVVRTPRFNDEPLPEADALVVIAFGQKISQSQANHPRLGAMNLHASRLPRYRGAAPIHHALLNGETVVGNTVIRLADRMDAGAMLGQSEVAVNASETTGELHDRLADDGPGLVLKVLDDLAAGRAIERPQDESQATAAPKLSREDARLDFTRPATAVAATINGLSPWPGCRVSVAGHTLKLLRALATPGQGEPGLLDDDGTIATPDGRVRILELQPDGKPAMPLDAYRNGKPWPAGEPVRPA